MAHKHAVVIGGSIAGLITARVLTDSFERVTVIERDQLPREAAFRGGTPQDRHVHNLLERGLNIMEDLFPGIEADLAAGGAPQMDWSKHICSRTYGGWLTDVQTNIKTRVASRGLVEWVIRRRIFENPNVEVLERTQVDHLLSDGNRITGVHLRGRGANQLDEDLLADFVVDASGRRSKTPDWLEALGYDRPEETVIDPQVGYATRLYKKPANFSGGWHVMYLPAKAPDKRGGAIFEIEGDVWMVSLGGYGGDYPPTDEDGFLAFARSIREPEFYEAFCAAEPLGGIVGYRRTQNRVRHYEQLARWPDRFVVLGDAVCGFNPIYGQGMTAAAMGAERLASVLRESSGNLDGLGAKFQRVLAKQNQTIWALATGEDFRHDTTIGERPGWLVQQLQRYVDWVLEAAPHDDKIADAFFQVLNLNEQPAYLFKPDVMAALFKHRVNGGTSQEALNPVRD